MRVARYFIVSVFSTVMAFSAAAQTTSPAPTTTPSTTRPAAAAPSVPGRTGSTATNQQQSNLVDINSASSAELDKLPGIGPSRAQAIIANRPFKGKDELVQRKIVPQSVYDQIKDKVIARQASATSAGASK